MEEDSDRRDTKIVPMVGTCGHFTGPSTMLQAAPHRCYQGPFCSALRLLRVLDAPALSIGARVFISSTVEEAFDFPLPRPLDKLRA